MKPVNLNGIQYMVSDKVYNLLSGVIDLGSGELDDVIEVNEEDNYFSFLTDEDIIDLLGELWANRQFVEIFDSYYRYAQMEELTGIDLAKYHGYKGKLHSMLLCYCGYHDLERVLAQMEKLWS